MQIVTLLTDFGISDAYVAQMKGVIYGLVPNCSIVDITHHIPAQDVLAGARVLRDSAMYFPRGTVHVAVVDPGVGTQRRLIAARIDGHFFVLPDNGLLSLLADDFPMEAAVELTEPKFWRNSVSHTFHGRDIMAPVAAHLVNGIRLSELGQPTNELKKLQELSWTSNASGARGVVIAVDHFGNVVTNLPGSIFEALSAEQAVRTRINGKELSWRWCATYGLTPPKTAVALIGSHGHLELAVNCGSAESEFGLQVGDRVEVFL